MTRSADRHVRAPTNILLTAGWCFEMALRLLLIGGPALVALIWLAETIGPDIHHR